MKNNNQKILRLLAKREYQENKRRNRILIGTVAFAVWMIFCVFSLAIGKIQADYLLMVRNGGTKASTTLEDPSEEQYRKIQELAYIRSAGMETDFAATDAFLCTVLDKTAWENMQKPAYTDIHGEYPTKENEIMLPMRALKLLGVSKPKLGMVIPVTMTDSEGEEHSGDFRLSGYYTEYVDPSMGKAYGYFSKTYLDQLDLSEVSRTLLIEQSRSVDGQTVEDRLYQDIPMRDDSQQFFGGTGLGLEAVTELVGGYDIAAVMAVVILLAAWLLIYNVLHISYGKDIRRFGFQCFWREHGFSSGLTGFKQNRSIFKGSGRFGSPGAFIPGNPFDASLWQLSECGSDADGFLPDSPISGNFRKWQMDGAGHPSGNFRSGVRQLFESLCRQSGIGDGLLCHVSSDFYTACRQFFEWGADHADTVGAAL